MKNKKSILLLPIILALPMYGGPGCNVPQNDGGIYKTVDRGANWKQITTIEESEDTLAKADTEQLLVDPNNPEVVFLVTKSNGLYVSNQFGESWKKILPEASAVYAIQGDPDVKGLFYASILLNDRAKIIKTENGGQDWKEVYTEAGKGNYVTNIKIDPFFESSLVAVNSEGLVIRSSDGGNTWQATYPFQENVIDFIFDPVKENFVWTLTAKGLWLSQDGGVMFKLIELPTGGEMGSIFNLMRKYEKSLFLATDKGFYQSMDDGKVWRKIIVLNNPTDFPVKDFVVFPNGNGGTWAMAAGMTLYLTADAGQTWKPVQFEIDRNVNAIGIKPNDPNQILVGVESASKGGLGF